MATVHHVIVVIETLSQFSLQTSADRNRVHFSAVDAQLEVERFSPNGCASAAEMWTRFLSLVGSTKW